MAVRSEIERGKLGGRWLDTNRALLTQTQKECAVMFGLPFDECIFTHPCGSLNVHAALHYGKDSGVRTAPAGKH